jgi:hypothetical protein
MTLPPKQEDSRYAAVRQYSLAQILAVWAAAAIPMAVLLTRLEQGTLRWSRVRDALWLLSPRSEERPCGWKGMVVGDSLRPPLRHLAVLRLRHHRTLEQGLRPVPGHQWRGVLPRSLGLVRGARRATRLQQHARRGPALPGVPASLAANILLIGYPTRRWQSAWMGIIVHSGQSVFVFFLILTLVLG